MNRYHANLSLQVVGPFRRAVNFYKRKTSMPYSDLLIKSPPKSLTDENAIRSLVLGLVKKGFTPNQISKTIVRQQPVDLDLLNKIIGTVKF